MSGRDAAPTPPPAEPPAEPPAAAAGNKEEAEEEECGFCVFMKGGGCKAAFEAWSACVDAARGDGADFADACRDATLALQACMEGNPAYYGDFILPKEEGEGGGDGGEAAAAAEEAAVLAAAADGAGHHRGEGGGGR